MMKPMMTLRDVRIVKETTTEDFEKEAYRRKRWYSADIVGQPELDNDWPACGLLELKEYDVPDAFWRPVSVDWKGRKATWTEVTKDACVELSLGRPGDSLWAVRYAKEQRDLPGL